MTESPERGTESDQLPEEAPPEQVVDDDSEGSRDEAVDSDGGAGDEGRATGRPEDA